MKQILASRELLLLTAIGLLLMLIAWRFPGFVAPSSLVVVFNDTSPLILLAIGQMIVILTRCIDLSVAANLALTGMVVSLVNIAVPSLPIIVIVLIVRHNLGNVEWHFGLETRHPANRRDAWHTDHFSWHHLPSYRG